MFEFGLSKPRSTRYPHRRHETERLMAEAPRFKLVGTVLATRDARALAAF